MSGREEVVRVLLSAGASMSTADKVRGQRERYVGSVDGHKHGRHVTHVQTADGVVPLSL